MNAPIRWYDSFGVIKEHENEAIRTSFDGRVYGRLAERCFASALLPEDKWRFDDGGVLSASTKKQPLQTGEEKRFSVY